MAQLYAGTSGFAYPKWKPDFYPADLASAKFLEHYARRLNSVEINYTFRRLPSASTLESWVSATAPGFLFAVKAHMRITHIHRLRGAGQATEVFLRAIDPLRVTKRLGPVLFQLHPQTKSDPGLLGEFLAPLPADIRYTFEFRHASWFDEKVYRLLERHKVCLCLAESDEFRVPEVVTADFVYCRLRRASYSAEERAAIGEQAGRLVASGKDVFLYFKHEETPEGARHAQELLAASGRA